MDIEELPGWLELARRGDQEAQEVIIEAFQPLVRSASGLVSQESGVDREELEAEGNAALFQAIFKWDEGRGPFPAMANYWVMGAMWIAAGRARRYFSRHATLDGWDAEGEGSEADDVAAGREVVELARSVPAELVPERAVEPLLERLVTDAPLSEVSRQIGLGKSQTGVYAERLLDWTRSQVAGDEDE